MPSTYSLNKTGCLKAIFMALVGQMTYRRIGIGMTCHDSKNTSNSGIELKLSSIAFII